jgi:hypothetical protein
MTPKYVQDFRRTAWEASGADPVLGALGDTGKALASIVED